LYIQSTGIQLHNTFPNNKKGEEIWFYTNINNSIFCCVLNTLATEV